jgi:pimeloyl-ACP methyl ester carboxylesterase
MTAPACHIDGIDVFIEGDGPHTVLMVHGWPDTHRLWDTTVEALKARHRCVRFTLAGFAIAEPACAMSRLAAQPDCSVTAFRTGHCVMVEQPAAFNESVSTWLNKVSA